MQWKEQEKKIKLAKYRNSVRTANILLLFLHVLVQTQKSSGSFVWRILVGQGSSGCRIVCYAAVARNKSSPWLQVSTSPWWLRSIFFIVLAGTPNSSPSRNHSPTTESMHIPWIVRVPEKRISAMKVITYSRFKTRGFGPRVSCLL